MPTGHVQDWRRPVRDAVRRKFDLTWLCAEWWRLFPKKIPRYCIFEFTFPRAGNARKKIAVANTGRN